MNNILSKLLLARNVAHVLHWQVKSLSLHLALGELYEALTEFADQLAEEYMGLSKETVSPDVNDQNGFANDPLQFIQQLHDLLEQLKPTLTQDASLINTYEEFQGVVNRIKYKVENLK